MESLPPLRRNWEGHPDLGRLKPQAEAEFQRLDPNIRYLWMIGRLIFWCFVYMGMIGFLILNWAGIDLFKGYTPLLFGTIFAISLLSISWPFVSFPHWGIAIRQTDVLIRSGVLWKRIASIPFARIQHVDSASGPIERLFGLANLVIHTAGAHLGSMSVPGLPTEYAEALRDYLSEVGHTHANL